MYETKRLVEQNFRNLVVGRFRRGQTVRQIRAAVGSGGLRGFRPTVGGKLAEPYSFSNQLITDIKQEYERIEAATVAPSSSNPKPMQVGFTFGSTYRYTGSATLGFYNVEEDDNGKRIGSKIRDVEWPLSFDSNERLKRSLIREKFESIIEKSHPNLVRKGQIPDEDLAYYVVIEKMTINRPLQSA